MKRVCMLIMFLAAVMLAVPAEASGPSASGMLPADSLADVLTETDGGQAALDLDRLAERYDEGQVSVSAALPGDDYEPLATDDGLARLPSDGTKKLVIVENQDGKVLWAGVTDGAEDAPQQMAYCEWREPAADDPVGEEPGLTLDLTEIADLCEGPLTVQAAVDGSAYTVKKVESGEDAVCQISGDGELWYVLVGSGADSAKDHIWAGVFPGGQTQGVFVLHPYPGFFEPSAWTPDAAEPAEGQTADAEAPVTITVEEPAPEDGADEDTFEVRVLGFTGTYDGQTHFARALTEERAVRYSYAICDELDETPGEVWHKGFPFQRNAGEMWAFVRAEKPDRTALYVDEDGQPCESQDWVKVHLRIEPAPVTISLWAEQMGTAEYSGREQELAMAFCAKVTKDAADGYPLAEMIESTAWVEGRSVSGKDAGSYPVQPTGEQLRAIAAYDGNFAPDIQWQESCAEISPKPVRFESASAVALYEPADGALTADSAVRGVQELAAGDYYSGDVVASGEQLGVGVGTNKIVLSGQFAERQANYTFDLEKDEGKLVVFPQSIDPDDPEWDEAQAMDLAADYEPGQKELPGYYDGVTVKLESDASVYDGKAKKIGLLINDKQNNSLPLTEGEDYSIKYTRNGRPTNDLASPGTIGVQITGEGNYTGTVELSYEIEMASVEALVRIDDWVYDGLAAGSEEHPVTASGPEGTPEYAYYDESGAEVPAPKDVGTYQLTVSWPETEGYSAVTASYDFSISPAKAVVYAGGGSKVYGEEDPALEVERIEGLFGRDTIPCKVTREAGEDAGVYETTAEAKEQDNYYVVLEPGTFTIEPLPLSDEAVETDWSGSTLEINWNGKALEEGVDYTLATEQSEDEKKESCVLTGQGNFTGERVVTRDKAEILSLTLDEVEERAESGAVRLSGTVATNVDVNADRLSVRVGGEDVKVRWSAQSGGTCRFAAVEELLPESGAKQLAVTVLLDGEQSVSGTLRLPRENDAVLWACLTAGLFLAATASLLICLRLTKRLKKEREKLLDAVSRQSSRTVRQSEQRTEK